MRLIQSANRKKSSDKKIFRKKISLQVHLIVISCTLFLSLSALAQEKKEASSEELAKQIAYTFSHPKEAMQTAERGQRIYLEHTWRQERRAFVDMVGSLFKGTKAA